MNARRKRDTAAGEVRLRALVHADLDAVTAIDGGLIGRSRRGFFDKRLRAAEADADAFVAVAAEDGRGLAGYMLAGVLGGEFGGTAPVAVLEAVGVRDDARGRGAGRALLGGLDARIRARGISEIRTQSPWTDHDLLRFFDATGFTLAPRRVLERSTTQPVDF